MSIEAELINSLKNIETRIDSLTQKTAKAGQSLRVPMEDAAKAVKKVETNFEQFGTKMHHTANNLGAKIAEQLTGRLLAVLGPIALVDAGIGAISNRIEQNRQRVAANAQQASSWATGTRGIAGDSPALRNALGASAPILSPDEASGAMRAFVGAGGSRTVDAAQMLGEILKVAPRMGWDVNATATLAGRLNKGGIDRASTAKDVIAYMLEKGLDSESRYQDPRRAAGLARNAGGAFSRLAAQQRVSQADIIADQNRMLENVPKWAAITDLGSLAARNAELAASAKGMPGYSPSMVARVSGGMPGTTMPLVDSLARASGAAPWLSDLDPVTRAALIQRERDKYQQSWWNRLSWNFGGEATFTDPRTGTTFSGMPNVYERAATDAQSALNNQFGAPKDQTPGPVSVRIENIPDLVKLTSKPLTLRSLNAGD